MKIIRKLIVNDAENPNNQEIVYENHARNLFSERFLFYVETIGGLQKLKQHRKFLKRLLLVCAAVLFMSVPSATCEAARMTDSPYVTISGDGTRFMIGNGIALPYTDIYTNYIRSGTSPEYWYPVGTERSTGIQSELRELKTGEHYYVINRSGEIPVGKWVVAWSRRRCIHDHEIDNQLKKRLHHAAAFLLPSIISYSIFNAPFFTADSPPSG